MTLAGVLLAVGAIGAVGHALALLGGVKERPARSVVALALGLGAWSLAFAAAIFAFGLSSGVVVAKDAFLIVLGVALHVRRRAPDPIDAKPLEPWTTRVLVACVAGASLLALGLLWNRFAASPEGTWDAWAIWNARARFLLAGEGRTFVRGFASANVHADYPFLLPGAVAQGWRWLGEGPAVAAVLGALFLGIAVAAPALLLGRLRGKAAGLAAALALLGAPAFVALGAAQTADVPLAAFVVVALGFVVLALDEEDGRKERLALAGFAAGLAAWTKNEGNLYLVAIGLAALVAPKKGRLERAIAFGLGALPALLVLATFKLGFAPRNDIVEGLGTAGARASDPVRLVTIGRAAGAALAQPGRWGAALLVPVVALALGKRGNAAARAVLVAVLVAAAGFVVVYLVTPLDLVWHLEHSLERLVAQLLPAAVLGLFLRLPAPLSSRTGPSG